MPKKQNSGLADIAIFIAWYKRDQWEEWLDISVDQDVFEDTYDEWILAANKAITPMKAAGARCIKVDIDVHKFHEWCRLNDRPLDGEGRTAYAVDLGKQKFKLN